MTIDEMIRKLRDHKKAGLPGTTEVVGAGRGGLSIDVSSFVSTKVVTVRMDEDRLDGIVVDGRGKPKGTERAVKLL